MSQGHANRESSGPDSSANLYTYIAERAAISPTMLEHVRRIADENGEDIARVLLRTGVVAESALANLLADYSACTLVDRRDYPESFLLEQRVSLKYLQDQLVLPLSEAEDTLEVAAAFPHDTRALNALRLATGKSLLVRAGIASTIAAQLSHFAHQANSITRTQSHQEHESLDRLRDLASEAPVVRFVSDVFNRASELGASDIHIEPLAETYRIRYRVDGVLWNGAIPILISLPAVVSRIKLLAGLDIGERRLPQDGKIALQLQGRDVDFRVATVPSVNGETIVLRLLRRDAAQPSLESLGFAPEVSRELTAVVEQPHGIVLVTGPTGSGKSTTLYALLAALNDEQRKIISVEDPVEYQIEGITQIQARPTIGLSFATALRAIVRHDPDVIMIGEIRDEETARIAIQSALTGHMVLSTLHTNDAGSSITRLLDMGIEPYLITSTLRGVLAQRLVRTRCPSCRQGGKEWNSDSNVSGLDNISVEGTTTCTHCGGTGYRGRTVISEYLPMIATVNALTLERAGGAAIEAAGRAAGMITLAQDGQRLVASGITTDEEIWRVTRAIE